MSGGYAKYLKRMIPMLSRSPEVEQLDVLLPPTLSALAKSLGRSARCWPEKRGRAAARWIRDAVRESDSDVVFIPSARWMAFDDVPSVVMLRNMEPLTAAWSGLPTTERLRNIARRLEARRACIHASRVIAVSAHVHDYLTSKWHIDPRRIGLVYHGVDVVTPVDDALLPGSLTAGGFVLTAGSIRPARGLEDLLHAWPLVRARVPGLVVVIAGEADASTLAYSRRLRDLATNLGIASDIVWPGRLASEQLGWGMANAAAFVMTSRAEACPNTALEGLSLGALCVSTNTPPMPEFFASAARYYDAGAPESLASSLVTALQDDRSASYREAARSRARDFTWDDTLRGTLAQLQLAIV
jgi:glycosyltransferase involved in cell wall biosynthesis